ncbi:unnamed protein product [Arctia plantaginis]|uniref:Peptidase S1 domain-containing protein n=1 Tax=Arctia plantaginis TaxID=874455 RepID=A0A8S0YSC0_ARCPL|nr:unnamed protein product [Arctia plantaginis]
MAKFNLLCSLILVLVLNKGLVYNQSVQTETCPDIFTRDGSRIYGTIVLRGTNPVSQLELQASFSVVGYLTDYGRIEIENPMYALQNYNRGLPIQYRVYLPVEVDVDVSSQIPIVTEITVNGKPICNGPKLIPRQNQVITNFNLKQTSYLKRTGEQFGVGRPQLNQNDQLGGSLVDVQETPIRGTDEDLLNSLFNFQRNPAVQEIPVTRPARPLSSLRPLTPQKADPESYIPYFPREETTEPPQPVTTPRLTQRQPELDSSIECGTRSSGNDRLALVYNGRNYMRGDLPWLVAIYRKKGNSLSFICGGTLVSNRHVVTAAHCMRHGNERTEINDIVVKVGVHRLDDWGDEITVTRTLIDARIHESFNATSLQNDILVLTFTKQVKFNAFIRPACLWNGDSSLEHIVGASGTVAGWGAQINQGAGIGEPQLVNVPIVRMETCRSSNIAFYKITSDKSFCAGDRRGSGPCSGDSGGGFYLLDGGKWRLRGIVSFSLRAQDGSCDLKDYVVFTDTAKYLPWIRQVLSKEYFD